MFGLVPRLQRFVIGWGIWPAWTVRWFENPVGPFTIFFYCPLAKWAISFTNIREINKPIEQVNTLQQCAIALTGTLFARWCFMLTPLNYMLSFCNAFMAGTGYYQLSRKLRAAQLM